MRLPRYGGKNEGATSRTHGSSQQPTMEHELPAGLRRAALRTLRIPRGKGSSRRPPSWPISGQATTMAKDRPTMASTSSCTDCTAAGFIAGPERDAQVEADLSAVTGSRRSPLKRHGRGAEGHRRTQHRARHPVSGCVNERLKFFSRTPESPCRCSRPSARKPTGGTRENHGRSGRDVSREVMRAKPGVERCSWLARSCRRTKCWNGLEREFQAACLVVDQGDGVAGEPRLRGGAGS